MQLSAWRPVLSLSLPYLVNKSSSEYMGDSRQQLTFSSRPIADLAGCLNYYSPELFYFLPTLLLLFLDVEVIS